MKILRLIILVACFALLSANTFAADNLQVTLISDKSSYAINEPISLKYKVTWKGHEDAEVYINNLAFPELEVVFNQTQVALQNVRPIPAKSKSTDQAVVPFLRRTPGRHEIRVLAPGMSDSSRFFVINKAEQPLDIISGLRGNYVFDKEGTYLLRTKFDISNPWKLSNKQDQTVWSNTVSINISDSSKYEAGFDCNKAKSIIEKTICSNSTLAALDKSLNLDYQKLVSSIPESVVEQFRNDQRAWLKSRDATCAASKTLFDCIKDAYDQRINLFESWSLSVRTNHFKEDYILIKDPSLIPLTKIFEEFRRSRERYRLIADFNNDGIDDVALSYDTSMFGNAGGQFFLFLGKSDGTYRQIGSFFAHPLAINLKKTTKGESMITTYARSNAGSGYLVEERITNAGVFLINRTLIQPGDSGVSKDQKLYDDLFGSATRLKAEISETTDNVVTWKPYK